MILSYSKASMAFITAITALCAAVSGAEVNLALHRPYEISPKPNYPLCTDADDVWQLTDGRKRGSNWTQRTTVGWQHCNRVPEITIDLGRVYSVSSVRIYTVSGSMAGVFEPYCWVVMLSNDGSDYRFAGFDTGDYRGDPVEKRRQSRKRTVDNIGLAGRYVKIFIQPRGEAALLFLDEVEILGTEELDPSKGEKRVRIYRKGKVEEVLDLMEHVVRLRREVDTIRQYLDKPGSALVGLRKEELQDQLAGLDDQLKSGQVVTSSWDAEAVERELGLVRSAMYRAEERKQRILHVGEPMRVLHQRWTADIVRAEEEEIDVSIWQGEYESFAINLVNDSNDGQVYEFSIAPLMGPGDLRLDSEGILVIRKAAYVFARDKGYIADALPLMTDRAVELAPGETVQLWFTVHMPKGCSAGQYQTAFYCSVNDSGGERVSQETMPIRILVHDIAIDADDRFQTIVWAYPGVASKNSAVWAAIDNDLSRHYVNVCVVHPEDIPWPDAAAVRMKPDFQQFDIMLSHSKYARKYLLLMSLGRDWTTDKFGQWGSSSWERNFGSWVVQVAEHLKGKGLGYDDFAFYPFDERLDDDVYRVARIVKAADPNLKIFSNWIGSSRSALSHFRDIVDIWCLQEKNMKRHGDLLKMVMSFGAEVWAYESNIPGKANDPYSYYRLMPWRAFERGQTGAGFWCYISAGHDWNDIHRPAADGDVVYLDEKGGTAGGEYVIPSRRWEAWRDGVEDYHYLHTLKGLIDDVRTASPELAAEGEQVLNAQLRSVLGAPGDAGRVAAARREITAAVLKIGKAITARCNIER